MNYTGQLMKKKGENRLWTCHRLYQTV